MEQKLEEKIDANPCISPIFIFSLGTAKGQLLVVKGLMASTVTHEE